MSVIISNVTENYRERIQRLALFDPLYKLQNKNSKDSGNKPIDYFSLGLLALLFFFENMLMRNKKTGVKELAAFLQEITDGEVDLNKEGFEKVARNIIEIFRPATGKRNSKVFFNWETRKEDSVQYSILKADKADLTTNTQYYTLDDQGLELIFATKEYFNEFQLSINQLVLRKQLEKGEFVGALRQIGEMGLDVKNLQDRIVRIKHEVNRNIVSTETYERYKNIVEDINIRLNRENEEFDELQAFVKDTKEKVGNEITNDKDRKAYDLIIEIDRELGQVHYEHRLLLKESIILKTTALQAAQDALYYVGIDSFNFDQEITSRVFSSPLPLNSTRRLIEPFMYLEKYETWSPLSVFAMQRLENKDKTEKTQEFLSLSEDEEAKLEIKKQSGNFMTIAGIILETISAKNQQSADINEVTLLEVIEYMKENNYERILDYRVFYDFWIILHQKSPIAIGLVEKGEELLFGEAYNLLMRQGSMLRIEETQGILQVTERFTIRNMILRLESNHDSL